MLKKENKRMYFAGFFNEILERSNEGLNKGTLLIDTKINTKMREQFKATKCFI